MTQSIIKAISHIAFNQDYLKRGDLISVGYKTPIPQAFPTAPIAPSSVAYYGVLTSITDTELEVYVVDGLECIPIELVLNGVVIINKLKVEPEEAEEC